MKNYYFFDTSAIVALVLVKDIKHEEAVGILNQLEKQGLRPLVSDYIISEVLTLLKVRAGNKPAVNLASKLKDDKSLLILYTGQKEFYGALDLFIKYQDKGFSFVDCVSFALMSDKKIKKAFTFDKHFEQFGFEAV